MTFNNPRVAVTPAEFSVSPIPWVTSSIATGIVRHTFGDATLASPASEAVYVSKWIVVQNADTGSLPLDVAFTRRGFDTSNHFSLSAGQSFSADLRLISVWVSGSGTPYQVIAGLTGIRSDMVPVITASNGYPGVG